MNDVVCFRIQPAIFTAAKWHFEPWLWICIMSTWNNAPLIPRLCHMCASHIFTECAQSDKMHQRWYQRRDLLPLSRITNVLCVLSYDFTFWFQRSPLEPLSWAWHRLMTRWCDIGHFANCMHSAKISLYSLSFTLFTPALEHSVLNGGSFAFQSSLLPPPRLHHQHKCRSALHFYLYYLWRSQQQCRHCFSFRLCKGVVVRGLLTEE